MAGKSESNDIPAPWNGVIWGGLAGFIACDGVGAGVVGFVVGIIIGALAGGGLESFAAKLPK